MLGLKRPCNTLESDSEQCKLLPKVILLMPCKETVNHLNVFLVLRYHIPKKYKILEEFVHHVLFLLYLFTLR